MLTEERGYRPTRKELTVSRVHCVDCATSVVVDPQGICPEGHHVGAGGARVEAAMGSRTAHPDEPEPWVHRIEANRTPRGSSGTNGHHEKPARELRPVRVPGASAEGFDDEPADSDALLRELHSLAALEERVPPPLPAEVSARTAAQPRPPQPPDRLRKGYSAGRGRAGRRAVRGRGRYRA